MKKNHFAIISLLLFFLSFLKLPLCAEEEHNEIIVCDNGLEMFHWDLDFLREAKQSVEVLACFFGGETAQQLLTALEERLIKVPDLQVYLLTSPLMMQKADFLRVEDLQHHYPHNFHITYTSQVARIWPEVTTTDNHVKTFIVDEKYFSVGGTNLEAAHCSEGTFTPYRAPYNHHGLMAFLPAGMRDQDIVGKGPLAKELRRIFYQLFSLWENYSETQLLKTDPESFKSNSLAREVNAPALVERFEKSEARIVLNTDQVKLLLSGPHQKKSAITEEYVRLINEAKEEILLSHLYFFPVEPIERALREAVKRGVKLRVVTNGITESSPEYTKLFGWANRMSYVPMFYGGTFHFWDKESVRQKPIKNTEIFEYDVKNVLLHKKMMLVDGKTFVLGSYNLGIKSAHGDYELILVIESEPAVQAARKVFEKDLLYSRKISAESAREWYFDPVTAYWGEMQKKYNGFL